MATKVIYEGDQDLAHSHLSTAENLLHKVRVFMTSAKIPVYSSTLRLDDYSYAYVLKAGDMEVIHIFAQPETEESTTTTFKGIPDFLSGVINGGMIRTDIIPPTQANPKEQKVRYLEKFRPNGPTAERHKLDPTFKDNKRLAVIPSKSYFNDFVKTVGENNPGQARDFSQYVMLSPSNYTGKMKALVQIIFGLGKIPPDMIIEEDKRTYDTLVKEGVQLVFDCRYVRSHGLYKAPDGVWWLIEISLLNGVIAMPLKMYPTSGSLKSSKYPDLAQAAEEFGGIPTGVGFPSGKKLRKAIEEGTVLELIALADMGDFATRQPYYSMCGWAFNSTGTEAHNTCWYFHRDGMRRGEHYSIHISIGPLKKDRQPKEPIANGAAAINLVSEGRMMHNSIKNPPPFKMHEPLLGGLISYDFLPVWPVGGELDAHYQRIVCDTTMFVYFNNDNLTQVKFYNNRNVDSVNTTEDNFEDCMYVGSWQQTTISGRRALPTMFYTTDVDDREEFADIKTVVTITGTPLGMFGPGFTDSFDPAYCSYFRYYVFKADTKTVRTGGETCSSAILIPEGLREGYVYCYYNFKSGRYTSTASEYKTLTDVYSYTGYRVLFGDSTTREGIFTRDRKVKSQNPVSGSPCAMEYANQGPWAEVGDPIVMGPQFNLTTSPGTSKSEENIVTTRAMIYTATEQGNIQINSPTAYEWGTYWFPLSPHPQTGIMNFFSVIHTGHLGELHMLYDLNINPTWDQRASVGTYCGEVRKPNERIKLNFTGVL